MDRVRQPRRSDADVGIKCRSAARAICSATAARAEWLVDAHVLQPYLHAPVVGDNAAAEPFARTLDRGECTCDEPRGERRRATG